MTWRTFIILTIATTAFIVLNIPNVFIDGDASIKIPCVFDEDVTDIPITFGTTIFGISNALVYKKALYCISTWLLASDKSRVILYGSDGDKITEALRSLFGKERVVLKRDPMQRYHIQTVPEYFAALQSDSGTDAVAYINNDIILYPELFEILAKVDKYFSPEKRYGIHTGRKDIPHHLFDSLPEISKGAGDRVFSRIYDIDSRYKNKPAEYGFDIFLWNKKNIEVGKKWYPPFLIGRPYFEYWFYMEVSSQGTVVSTFPNYSGIHLNHPERKQWVNQLNHPDVVWNKLVRLTNRNFKSFKNIRVKNKIDMSGFISKQRCP